MMMTVRQNVATAVEPASWLAVDELLVAFQARSVHTIKTKNTLISETSLKDRYYRYDLHTPAPYKVFEHH